MCQRDGAPLALHKDPEQRDWHLRCRGLNLGQKLCHSFMGNLLSIEAVSGASPGGRCSTLTRRENAHPPDGAARAYDSSTWEIEADEEFKLHGGGARL